MGDGRSKSKSEFAKYFPEDLREFFGLKGHMLW
jgi:hypothetical protein